MWTWTFLLYDRAPLRYGGIGTVEDFGHKRSFLEHLEKPGKEQGVLGDPLDRDHQEGGEVHPAKDLVLHLRHLDRKHEVPACSIESKRYCTICTLCSLRIEIVKVTFRKTLSSSFSLSMLASSIEEAACFVQYVSKACMSMSISLSRISISMPGAWAWPG